MASEFTNIWGIYDKDGNLVLQPDNMMDFRYDNSSRISTFPTEEGSFASYNKVRSPFRAKVTMSVGGDSAAMEEFMARLDAVVDDTELYDIVTPERTYINANIEKVSYARAHNKGVNCIVAHMELMEVRQVSPAYASVTINAKKPQAKDQKKSGKKQTEDTRPDYHLYSYAELTAWTAAGLPVGGGPKRPKAE